MMSHAQLELLSAETQPDCAALSIAHESGCVGHTGLSAEATRILEELREAVKQDPKGARASAARLVKLLACPAGVAFARGGLAPWQKRKLDHYIRERLVRPVQVDELAKQVSLSVSYFCRAFKATFGDTPHGYIIRLRLEMAQHLMLTTDDALSQIALACGFADQSHLCKAFRRVVDDPPSAWRRRNSLMHAPSAEA